jgi:SAM-dependent methyltransferase
MGDAARFDESKLRDALLRRLQSRATVQGWMSIPAVPSALDEYARMCETVFAGMGVRFTAEQTSRLKAELEFELANAFTASSRSVVYLAFNSPAGKAFDYRLKADWISIEADYDQWVELRPPPLFGVEPDARVCALADEATEPAHQRVLDIGAGTGRNALALARRGHPVDAVEMTPNFAATLRSEAAQEALDIRVIQEDVFTALSDVNAQYQLIVVSEVVPDFVNTAQLRALFELSARLLTPGGQLLLNAFFARPGYALDSAARELGQLSHCMVFTRDELAGAVAGLPVELIADDSAYDYEKAHLAPRGAWPPTGWYEAWASGLDLFDVAREDSPIELRWLVYRRV